jgi:RimJ/RimL family protein N-acetyltransferase
VSDSLNSLAKVSLRPVIDSDLPSLYEQQRDPEAAWQADFQMRAWEPFLAHWQKILAKEDVSARVILVDGQVAGNLVSFEMDGHREVGYWLGREFWGHGIATRALAAFVELVEFRPLYGYVVKEHLASQRVLEKCGFRPCGSAREFSTLRQAEVEFAILVLE